MAVTVTSANTNDTNNGNRVAVRTSAGVPYVVVCDSTDDSIEVWKGNSTTPTSFDEQDTANNPDNTTFGSMSAAIDSAGLIHIVYAYYASKSDDLRYVQFNTATDAFQNAATINADLGGESTSVANLYTSIAIDANDIPHVAYVGVEANAGTVGQVVRYENRIGGAWNGTGVEVEGQTANVDCNGCDIAIDADNKPVITYSNGGDFSIGTAIGNANDATSFTLFDLADTTIGHLRTSVAVDSSGNHWVAYKYYNGTGYYLYRQKHNYGDAWTTWQAADVLYNSTSLTDPATSPSIVCDGTDTYVFLRLINADVYYFKNTDAGVVLETDTFNTVKAKWGFWVDNGSGGSLLTNTTYYFDGSDVPATDFDNVWANETNSDDGDTGTKATTTTSTTSPSVNEIQIQGTNAPASGDFILYVYARVYGGTNAAQSWGSYVLLTVPAGGWTWAKIQALETTIMGWGASLTVYIHEDGNAGTSTYLGICYGGGAINDWAVNRVEIKVVTKPATATELDYVFTDETASPDIWWNKLALAAAPLTYSASDRIQLVSNLAGKRVFWKKSLSDTSVLQETLNKTKRVVKSVSDALSLQETMSKIYGFGKSVSDALSLNGALNKITRFKKALSDAVILTGNIVVNLVEGVTNFTTSLSDAIGLNEVFSKVANFKRQFTDTMNLSEIFSKLRIINKSFTDSLILTETFAGFRRFIKQLTDSISLIETLNKLTKFKKTVSDAINLIESIVVTHLGPVTHYTYLAIETIYISVTQVVNNFTQSVAEVISLNENLAKITKFRKSLVDVVSLTEILNKTKRTLQSLSDTINLTETVSPLKRVIKTLSDSTSLTEILTKVSRFKKTVSDTVVLMENFVKSGISYFTAILSDALSLAETFNKLTRFKKSFTEGMILIETISAIRKFTKSVSDSVTLIENLVKRFDIRKVFLETIIIIELLTFGVRRQIVVLADTLRLTEALTLVGRFWDWATKHIATWIYQTKNSSAWAFLTKNVASWGFGNKSADPTWTHQTKNTNNWSWQNKQK